MLKNFGAISCKEDHDTLLLTYNKTSKGSLQDWEEKKHRWKNTNLMSLSIYHEGIWKRNGVVGRGDNPVITAYSLFPSCFFLFKQVKSCGLSLESHCKGKDITAAGTQALLLTKAMQVSQKNGASWEVDTLLIPETTTKQVTASELAWTPKTQWNPDLDTEISPNKLFLSMRTSLWW